MKTSIYKGIKILLLIISASMGLVACSSTEDSTDSNLLSSDQIFKISNFPSYSDNTSSRSTGTFDAGKTSWASGDIVYAKLEVYENYADNACSGTLQNTYLYKLTYNGSAWAPTEWDSSTSAYSDVVSKQLKAQCGLRVSAYYAPNYELNTTAGTDFGKMKRKGGVTTYGNDEYLTFTKDMSAGSFSADNNNLITLTRNYSRLRVVAPHGLKIQLAPITSYVSNGTTITMPGSFIPAGESTTQTCEAVADENNNVYFYGKWSNDIEVNINVLNGSNVQRLLYIRSFVNASVDNKSTVVNAMPTTYNAIGAGTAADPYQIYTLDQLKNIDTAASLDGISLKLMNDIDCGDPEVAIKIDDDNHVFGGIFDGNGYTISNCKLGLYSNSSYSYVGLFPYVVGNFDNTSGVGDKVIIKNLTLKNTKAGDIITEDFKGGLIGYMTNGAVVNCQVIDGSWVKTDAKKRTDMDNPCIGGLIGRADKSFVFGCHSNLQVDSNSDDSYVGGLVGYLNNSALIASYSSGPVTTKKTANFAGGCIGYSYFSPVIYCLSSGLVINTAADYSTYWGAFVGTFYACDAYCIANFAFCDAGNYFAHSFQSNVVTETTLTQGLCRTNLAQIYYALSHRDPTDSGVAANANNALVDGTTCGLGIDVFKTFMKSFPELSNIEPVGTTALQTLWKWDDTYNNNNIKLWWMK